jgi:hypothetical protein
MAEQFLADLDKKILAGSSRPSRGQDLLIAALLRQQQTKHVVWILNNARAGHYRDDGDLYTTPKLTLCDHLLQAQLPKMATNVQNGLYDEEESTPDATDAKDAKDDAKQENTKKGELVVVQANVGDGGGYILMAMSCKCATELNKAVWVVADRLKRMQWGEQFQVTITPEKSTPEIISFVRSPLVNAPVKPWVQSLVGFLAYADDSTALSETITELLTL